jgi:hypothetical protein
VWTAPVLSAARVYIGTELSSIYEHSKSGKDLWISIALITLSILLMIYIIYLSTKMYQEIVAEAEKEIR